jgi:hypothetical protein
MQTLHPARDSADAVARFATILTGADRAMRIDARWDGADGVAVLEAAEAAITAAWPRAAGKELVWLTGADARRAGVLRLQARGLDGALLGDAAFAVRPS